MRVVGYCRTSTEGQCGEDKFGIEAQQQAISGYCQEHDMEIVEWFIDEAVSGASLNPPAFNAILNGGIKNPPIEAVVVAKADRVARDIEKYFGFKFLLKRQDISLISVQEDFGSAGIFAPIYEAISAVFAQMEREFITQRMSGGRRAKAATGGYSGGKAPYGYQSVRGSKSLELCEKEVPLVKRIFELREQEDRTMKEICETLKAEGFQTRKGGDFQISTIKYILDNRKTYEGFYKYGDGSWVQGKHPAILQEVEMNGGKIS